MWKKILSPSKYPFLKQFETEMAQKKQLTAVMSIQFPWNLKVKTGNWTVYLLWKTFFVNREIFQKQLLWIWNVEYTFKKLYLAGILNRYNYVFPEGKTAKISLWKFLKNYLIQQDYTFFL